MCFSELKMPLPLHGKTHMPVQTKHSPTLHLFPLSRQTIAVEIKKKGDGED